MCWCVCALHLIYSCIGPFYVCSSYWTHPCDVEEMNSVLRECFIDLYNRPILEDVKRKWELRYPSITFPDIPPQGDLDLNEVRNASYFFQ